MKYILIILISTIGVITLMNIKDSKADISSDAPLVLEMFTSQSCSSCPPADKILNRLADENKNIIALSCNVTYWNHLHWQDTLSKEFCSIRQRDYVRRLKSRGPYTPQLVVNGKDEMVGSQLGKIKRSILKQADKPVKNIKLTQDEGELIIQLPETPTTDTYALHLISYGHSHTQDIPSGENKGRQVHYTNPVQDIISLGTWDGTGKKMDIDISHFDANKGFAVLAQTNGITGPIMAAGKVEN